MLTLTMHIFTIFADHNLSALLICWRIMYGNIIWCQEYEKFFFIDTQSQKMHNLNLKNIQHSCNRRYFEIEETKSKSVWLHVSIIGSGSERCSLHLYMIMFARLWTRDPITTNGTGLCVWRVAHSYPLVTVCDNSLTNYNS